jgi:uncharacterized membrane protein
MNDDVQLWLRAGHLISLFLWIGGLFSVYWLLRLHQHAPKDSHEKLTLMERSIALSMDLAAVIAIGTGLTMALSHTGMSANPHPTTTLFTAPGAGWFHIKLTLVVLGVLSVHGMLRARIKRFGMGDFKPVPQWLWSVFMVSLAVIVILVFRGPKMFAKKIVDTAPATEPAR